MFISAVEEAFWIGLIMGKGASEQVVIEEVRGMVREASTMDSGRSRYPANASLQAVRCYEYLIRAHPKGSAHGRTLLKGEAGGGLRVAGSVETRVRRAGC